MVIYGLALLSACFFGGMLLGDILGMITGVGSMSAVWVCHAGAHPGFEQASQENKLSTKAQDSIMFWKRYVHPPSWWQ